MRAFWRDQRGSQVVEFVLIAPLLIFLIFMVPTLGTAVRAWLVVENAAREGARVVSLGGPAAAAAARQAAFDEVTRNGGLPASFGTKALIANDAQFIAVDAVNGEVSVTYYQPVFLPFLGVLVGGHKLDDLIVVTGKSRFLPEYQNIP